MFLVRRAAPGAGALRRALCVAVLLLAGCSGGGGSGSSSSPPSSDPPLSIATTTLPAGKVGVAYSAQLTATGGTAPLSWALTSGTLPAGLTLAASGLISGTPTASAAAVSLTFTVTDSSTTPNKHSVTLQLTVAAGGGGALSISTTSLPMGYVSSLYSGALIASGGTAPLSWSLTAGTLPAGLTLASNGVIAGTPIAVAAATPLTFTVIDSSASPQQRSVALSLTVNPAITVAISPARAALTVTQSLTLSASTTDPAGVSWSTTPAGGGFSSGTSASGKAVTFTAAATAGVYTVTATSLTDHTKTASITVGVTDLAGVYTYHNDASRDAVNAREFALNTTNVNTATFSKLFSCTVDGAIYPQPLWVANLTVGGARHNVVFVGTAQMSLYAFDADASSCQQLWHASLVDGAHGGTVGEISTLDAGILGTPVIDPVANLLYVVTKSANAANTVVYERMHVIDITTGNEMPGAPLLIAASYPMTGGTVTFQAQYHNQRAGLAMLNGTVYAGFGSQSDISPWFGWLIGFSYANSTLTQTSVLNTTPNGYGGGIWMSGGAPAIDDTGYLYVITGNGTFDANISTAPQLDYGDSLLQLSTSGATAVRSYFTPSDQQTDESSDLDFGSGGATIIIKLANGQHVIVGGGKDGALYLLNADDLGGLGDGNAFQRLVLNQAIYSTAAFWNNTLYIGPAGAPLQAYTFSVGSGTSSPSLSATPASTSPTAYPKPGAGVSISAGTSGDGIVWAIDDSAACNAGKPPCGPSVLHAYAASDLGDELWNSSMVATDAPGNAVKFTVPTIANGKVYIGTRGTDTGNPNGNSSTTGELDVYALKSN